MLPFLDIRDFMNGVILKFKNFHGCFLREILYASDKYPLDMAGRTYLKANFKKILATEDPKVGSLMLPFLDI
jgi:hypothetical protein